MKKDMRTITDLPEILVRQRSEEHPLEDGGGDGEHELVCADLGAVGQLEPDVRPLLLVVELAWGEVVGLGGVWTIAINWYQQ